MFVASSNTVPDPHLEDVSISNSVISLITSNDGCVGSSTKEIVLSNPLFTPTAPPITAKITKTPTTIKVFFLLPLLDVLLIFSSNVLSEFFLELSSVTLGFFISVPQSRQNLEFTGMDLPHFQQ